MFSILAKETRISNRLPCVDLHQLTALSSECAWSIGLSAKLTPWVLRSSS
jgi:hypothetical protein